MSLRSGALKIALAMLFTNCSPQGIAVPSPTPQTAIVQHSNPRFERTSPPAYIQGDGYRRVSIEEWSRYNTGQVYDEPRLERKAVTLQDVMVDGTNEYLSLLDNDTKEKYVITLGASGEIKGFDYEKDLVQKFDAVKDKVVAAVQSSFDQGTDVVQEIQKILNTRNPYEIGSSLEQASKYVDSQQTNQKAVVLYEIALMMDNIYQNGQTRKNLQIIEQKYPAETNQVKQNISSFRESIEKSFPAVKQIESGIQNEMQRNPTIGKAIDIKTGKEATPDETRQRLSDLKDESIQTVQKGVEQVIQKVNEVLPKIELPKHKK